MKQLKTILFVLFVATTLTGTAFAEKSNVTNTVASSTTAKTQQNHDKVGTCWGNLCT